MNFDLSISGTDVTVELETVDEMLVQMDTPQLLLPVTGLGVIGTGTGGSVLQVWGETPGGLIDGVNRNFTSLHLYSPTLLAVYLNGIRQRRASDYTETGSQSFQFVTAPLPGDSLSIDYVQP
jgi:hypothetical protein